jgi:hypothetical protein
MKVAGMTQGRLESRASLAEVDLVREAGGDHPLQCAVDGRAANPGIFLPNEIVQLVGGQMASMPQEDIQDTVALTRALSSGRAKARKIQAVQSTEND